jgi:hypothetical protein
MSPVAISQGTKLFGFQIPIQPKLLVGGLFGIVAGLAIYNFMGGGDDASANSSRSSVKTLSSTMPSLSPSASRRDLSNKNKQGTLRLKPVDPTSVADPTLKLALLDRVRTVKLVDGGRNLFDSGPDLAQTNLPPVPKVAPMMPKSQQFGPPMPPPKPGPPPLNIPLRYYGFVRPSLRADGNRGYFMDGENILMATEGDVLESRFLVVALSPNTARVEDIQLKQGQDLQLIPEAVVTQ